MQSGSTPARDGSTELPNDQDYIRGYITTAAIRATFADRESGTNVNAYIKGSNAFDYTAASNMKALNVASCLRDELGLVGQGYYYLQDREGANSYGYKLPASGSYLLLSYALEAIQLDDVLITKPKTKNFSTPSKDKRTNSRSKGKGYTPFKPNTRVSKSNTIPSKG